MVRAFIFWFSASLLSVSAYAFPPGVESTASFPYALMQRFPGTMEKVFENTPWQFEPNHKIFRFRMHQPTPEAIETVGCSSDFDLTVEERLAGPIRHMILEGVCDEKVFKLRLSVPADQVISTTDFVFGQWVRKVKEWKSYEIEILKEGTHHIIHREFSETEDYSEYRDLNSGSAARVSTKLADSDRRVLDLIGYGGGAVTIHYQIVWRESDGRFPSYKYFDRRKGVDVELRVFQKDYGRAMLHLMFDLGLQTLF